MTTINLVKLKEYCAQKPGTAESYPFGEDTLVFKVMGKMYALTNVKSDQFSINLKCDPDWAMFLRDHYQAVKPGYHMNKRHWNTVLIDGSIPDDEVFEMIDHSYRLVVKGLKKADRQKLISLP